MRAVVEAWRDMLVAALFVAGVTIVVVEARHGLADRRYAQALREAKHQTEVRAAQSLLDRRRRQAVADYAFDLAEQQALAQRQATQGRLVSSSPFRAAAQIASLPGEHDRLGVSDAVRDAQVARLEAEFHHEARPPVTADTDPDGTVHRW